MDRTEPATQPAAGPVTAGAAKLQRRTDELPIDAPRSSGSVRWYSEEKGYGFIRPDDGGPEVFVRYSAIDGDGFRTLTPNQRVTFEPSSDGRGPRALAVRPEPA